MKYSRPIARALIAVATLAIMLVPAAQADPSFYATPIFGIANAPGGALYVADAGQGVVDADSGALVAPIFGLNDVAPIGRGEMLGVGSNDEGTGLVHVSRGRTDFVADTAGFEATVDPAGDGTDEGSNPFDLARLSGHKTLVADAAGNSLLYIDSAGRIDWVASFPEQGGIQPVPTAVAAA